MHHSSRPTFDRLDSSSPAEINHFAGARQIVRRKTIGVVLAIGLAVAGNAGSDAFAQTSGTLATQANQNWSTAPWTITSGPGAFPTGGGVATLNAATNITGTVPGGVTLTLDVTPTLSGITYNSPFSYTIAQSATNTLGLTTTGDNTFNVQLSIANTLSLFQLSNSITAPISGGGAFGLTKTGVGTLTLSGTNTYTGGTHINGGFVWISAAAAVGDATLGATGAGNGLSFNGGTLGINITSGWTTSRNIFLDTGGATLLPNVAATLNGTISGTGDLHLSGFAGAVTLTAANTYMGTTFTDAPSTLTISGANGTINQNSAYDFAGIVNLSNATANNNDRLSDTAAITSRGAVITIAGNSAAATTENAGALTLASGLTTITNTPNAAQAESLNFTNITRQNNSTLFVRGTSLGAAPAANVAQITSTASPGTLIGGGGAAGSTNISILPWAVGNTSAASLLSSSFVTWDAATGRLRPLATAEYATLTSGASTTNNTTMSVATAISAPTTVNSVRITGTGTLLTGNGGLNITSGALLYAPAANTAGTVSANVSFGGAEGVITNTTTAALTLSGILSGIGGLTLNPLTTGAIALTGANNYTGQTTLLGGQINYSGTIANDGVTAGAFGLSTSPIVMNTGSTGLLLWATAASIINRDITVQNNGPGIADIGTTGTTYTVTVNGTVALQGNSRLRLDAGTIATAAMIMNGNITGTGSITDGNGSFNILNGANTYSGGTNILTGTYAVGVDSTGTSGAFGTGTIYFSDSTTNAGKIQSKDATAHTIDNNILLGANATFQGTGALTFSGGLNLNGARTLTITDTAATGVTFSGLISNGALTRAGTGVLTLSGANNTYTGGTVLSTSGTVNANAAGTLGTGALTLSNATAIANINANQSIAGLSGATAGATVNIANTVNLTLNEPGSLSYSGIISGAGSLTKTGIGTQALITGTNTFGGGLFVNGGTLTFNQNTSLGTNDVSLGINGGGDATLVASNATASPTNNITVASGAGTLTLGTTSAAASGGNTYSGNILLNGGVSVTSLLTGTGSLKLTGSITGVGGITKVAAGSATLGGTLANTYTGLTTVSNGELDLNKTAGVNAIAGDGNTATNDVSVNGGTLKWLANEQVGDTATITVNTGGTVDLNGKTETLGSFINNGGTFQTGAGHLIGTTATTNFAGGTNTINSGGIVEDGHIVITGGTNTVQGGATEGLLHLLGSGAGLQMTGATLTLNSDATAPGRLLLEGDVSTSASATTSVIASGGAAANAGVVDLNAGTRTFTVAAGTVGGGGPTGGPDMTISAKIIAPGGALTKAGAGILELTGANTYAVGTTVSAGTLLANNTAGSATGSGGIMVNANGTLGGIGTINAGANNININDNGTITGGKNGTVGALTMTAANLVFGGSAGNLSTYAVDISGATSDLLALSGVLDLSSAFDQITFNGTADGVTTYALAQYTSETGTFDNFPTLPAGYQLIYGATELDLAPTAVPEPATWFAGALMLVGVGVFSVRRHRRRPLV